MPVVYSCYRPGSTPGPYLDTFCRETRDGFSRSGSLKWPVSVKPRFLNPERLDYHIGPSAFSDRAIGLFQTRPRGSSIFEVRRLLLVYRSSNAQTSARELRNVRHVVDPDGRHSTLDGRASRDQLRRKRGAVGHGEAIVARAACCFGGFVNKLLSIHAIITIQLIG